MGRRGQGVCAQRWCNVMLGAAKGVQLGGIRPGESCHDGRVHPSTGGQQLHPGDRLQTGRLGSWDDLDRL